MLRQFLCFCIAAALCVGFASAQKIGYVSTKTIQSKYEAYTMAEARLNALVEEWKTELDRMQTDIDDLELEIKKNRLVWTDQERQAKEQEVADRRRQREKFANEKFSPGGDHDKQAEILFKAVWEKIYIAIQKVSAEDGYDMVWDKSVQPLVYVNAKYDITVKVMKQLGIDAGDLEKKQLEVIDSDPRNKKVDEPRARRSRRRSTSPEVETIDSTTTNNNGRSPTPTDPIVPSNPMGSNPNVPPAPPPPPPDTTKRRSDEVPR